MTGKFWRNEKYHRMKPAVWSHPAKLSAGRAHPLLLAATFFLSGAIVTGIWFHRHTTNAGAAGLAAPTRNLLGQLPAPVAVRYYSLLPAGCADASLQAFAGRVADLLGTMQAASGGKLQITRIDTPADTNVTAASADGIQPFNLDKGGACFLGLTVTSGKNQETFARLQSEWEPALQFDLARAIERVTAVPPPARPAPEVARPSPELLSSIHRLIPDVKATSLEDADRIFHEEYLKQCTAAGKELEAQISAAGEQVSQAQSNGSAAELEAARQHLLQVQLAQGEKLKAIAARLQLQMAVFQQMKAASTNSPK